MDTEGMIGVDGAESNSAGWAIKIQLLNYGHYRCHKARELCIVYCLCLHRPSFHAVMNCLTVLSEQ